MALAHTLQESRTSTIAELNDICRFAMTDATLHGIVPCKVVKTKGINMLPEEQQLAIFKAVAEFGQFSEENDPYGEHDFGALQCEGCSIFWKIDYFDTSLQWGSEDATDTSKTMRVLTIMLAYEY